jgi:SagB-type dehydrogenase family enzyme
MFNPQDRLQTSQSLIALPNADDSGRTNTLGLYDFLAKSFAHINIAGLYWLQYFRDPKNWARVVEEHQNLAPEELHEELSSLIDAKFISLVGTETWCRNETFRQNWKWDLTTSLFHFTVTDNEFVTAQEAHRYQVEKYMREASPKLMWEHGPTAIALPSPFVGTCSELMNAFARRRTNRTSSGHALSMAELGKCLYAGLGIVGFTEGVAGLLPISMTPSGGARNPFEAFVILKRGSDLNQGIYHYSALEHSLNPLNTKLDVELSSLFANQEWMDQMAAVVVLVGVFERTMWKYPDPNAYRVIMIEAGHIVQNAMLAATELGLCACPTAALSHKKLGELFHLEDITHVPLYAFTLDRPAINPDAIQPNKNLSFLSRTDQAMLP